MSNFVEDLFSTRDSAKHYGQQIEMLGSTGSAHEENPHRICSASAQPQKRSKYVRVRGQMEAAETLTKKLFFVRQVMPII